MARRTRIPVPMPRSSRESISTGRSRAALGTICHRKAREGTYTAIPMLIAEELEVDLPQLRLEHSSL